MWSDLSHYGARFRLCQNLLRRPRVTLREMRAYILLSVLIVVALAGCSGPKEAATPAGPEYGELKQGTEIKLALMQTLESGVDDEGDHVGLIVTEPVVDANGHVIVAKGAIAEGKVVASRREDTMGALTNRPARLSITVDSVYGVDGSKVLISADSDGNPSEGFQFNRANTGRPEVSSAKLDEMMKDPKNEEDLKKLGELFVKKGSVDPNSPEAKDLVDRLSKNLQLPNLESVTGKGQTDQVTGLLSSIRSGMKIGGSLNAVGAVMELANVAGDVGSRLSRIMHGRNIKAYAGQPMTAKVVSDTKIAISP